MKKFYLSVGQRRTIISDLLEAKNNLIGELKKMTPTPSQRVTELAEENNQERDMLVALFKIEDHEL